MQAKGLIGKEAAVTLMSQERRNVICLHMAGFTWVTHLPQGHMVEGGEVQEGSQGSHVTSPMLSVPSLGQEPPLVLRHLGPWWPHQMRGVGCAPT